MARPRSISDEEIRTAAREVFIEHGPAAPVSLIAEKLGVSHATLFERVGTKEQLLLEALSPDRPRAIERLSHPPPHEHAREALVEVLTELMEFFHRVVPNLVVLRAAGRSITESPPRGATPPRDATPPPVALRRSLARWLQRASVDGALPPIRSRAVAEGLLGAMEARCFNGYIGGKPFAPGGDDAFLRELIEGLLGRSP